MTNDAVVLITGANSGLGYATTQALVASFRPYTILLGCMALSDGEAAAQSLRNDFPSSRSAIEPVEIDIRSDDSIALLVRHIQTTYGRLDMLINNAGVSMDNNLAKNLVSAREAWATTFSVNLASTSILTNALMPLILMKAASSAQNLTWNKRILFITSGTSSFSNTTRMDPPFDQINASPPAGLPKPQEDNPATIYRCSKTAINMLMREFARVFKEDGVQVFGVSPGFIVTGLGDVGEDKLRELGAADAAVGGEFVKDVLEGRWDDHEGMVVRRGGEQPQPW